MIRLFASLFNLNFKILDWIIVKATSFDPNHAFLNRLQNVD
jgi:hypothetical protein